MSDPKITKPEAIVIGASAGSLEALKIILPRLPQSFPLPIMIVVHLPPDKKSIMVDLLQASCKMLVKEAEDKEPIQNGIIYLAPPAYHLLVEKDKRLSLSVEEPVKYSRPSIDVLFETAADTYYESLIGIVLTGANDDGAHGAKVIEDNGGIILVQEPENAYAQAMPKSALKACKNARAMSLDNIANYLEEIANK